jgi:hypothetical protein
MDVEPRVRPGEHPGGLLRVEQHQPHEEPEHGLAERLGQSHRVVRGPRHKGPVRPEAAVGADEVPVRIPVRTGTMRLPARDDTDRARALLIKKARVLRRAGGRSGTGNSIGSS